MARGVALLAAVVALGLPGAAWAGAYVFSGETNGLDLITHPAGYIGTGGTLNVSVCIDPASPNAASMETPVRNIVHTWNTLAPITGNVLLGANNDVPASAVDFESVAVHELGHCIGLAHVNLASESGLGDPQANYTKSGDGLPNQFDLNDGADNVIGSGDDVRGDDQNLHWFRKLDNNPFTLAPVVDSTTYSRNLADLPAGHSYAANGDRGVSVLLGVPTTESVMQQGTFLDEDQRALTHDDVATLRYAMSGLDEVAGTADDYTVSLSYVGLTSACDVVLDFDNTETGFAVCQLGGNFIGLTDHAQITSAQIFFNTGFNWHFNPVLAACGNGALDPGEACDDGNVSDGDCCSAQCTFESNGSPCEAGDLCVSGDMCDGAGTCIAGAVPAVCDDGVFCNGVETCDSGAGCQAGPPPVCDDGVACTLDFCDATSDQCDAAADDAVCSDGLFCNGAEICDETLGCQASSDPCAPLTCSESADTCSCNVSTDCDDGLFCTGIEMCVDGLCAAGVPVACDDGVGCTLDGCNESEDACDFTPSAALCDNALFCDGVETCHPTLDCQPGAAVLCSDGVGCTVDSCNESLDQCESTPSDAACDDGIFCTGAEVCHAALDCQPGFDPCPSLVCDEQGDACTPPPPVVFGENATGTSSGSTSVTSASLSGFEGDLYLAAISTRTNVGVTAVTGLGLTWTPVQDQCASDDDTGVSVWQAQGSPSPSGAVTATFAAVPSNAVISVTRYTDVALPAVGNVSAGNTNGIEGACSGGPASRSYFFNVSTLGTNSVLWGAAAILNKNHSEGAGYTERAEARSGNGSSAAGLALQDRSVSTPASVSIDGSFNGPIEWSFVGVEVRAEINECLGDLECDDGLFCNGAERCSFGTCVPGSAPTCSDGNTCTTDSCDDALGCQHEPVPECTPEVPVASRPGLALLALLLAGAGGIVLRRASSRA